MPVATVEIVTAPGGYVQDPTNVMGRRIGAYLIDVALLLVLMAAIAIPIAVSDATHLDARSSSAATDYCDAFNNRAIEHHLERRLRVVTLMEGQ